MAMCFHGKIHGRSHQRVGAGAALPTAPSTGPLVLPVPTTLGSEGLNLK